MTWKRYSKLKPAAYPPLSMDVFLNVELGQKLGWNVTEALIGGWKLSCRSMSMLGWVVLTQPTQRHRQNAEIRHRDRLAIDSFCEKRVPENLCWCDQAPYLQACHSPRSFPVFAASKAASSSHAKFHFVVSKSQRSVLGHNYNYYHLYPGHDAVLRYSAFKHHRFRTPLSGDSDPPTSHLAKS